MATPNIASPTTINGKTVIMIPSTTSLTQIGSAAATGHIFKVDSITAANVTGTAATVTLGVYPTTNVTGTPSRIAFQITVPANASIILVDKAMGLWLDEGQSVGVTSGTTNAIEITMVYEDIS